MSKWRKIYERKKNVEQDNFIPIEELFEDKSIRKKIKFLNIRVVNNRIFNFRKSKFTTNHRRENRRLVGHFYVMKNRFWAVGCGLGCGKKGSGLMSNLWGRFFQVFVGKKKKIWKHCSVRTEKLHRKKVNFFAQCIPHNHTQSTQSSTIMHNCTIAQSNYKFSHNHTMEIQIL